MTRKTGRYRLVRPAISPVAAPDLDPSQRQVVEHQGGPLLVLAGPGTGKTTTLVEAVVARVEQGLRPDQVLVLTFSRKAADELRERITARLGRTVAEPAAYTFHSWCYGLVRAHASPGELPRLLSQAERDVRIRELLTGHAEGAGIVEWPAVLKPALRTRGFAREIASLFDRARERGLDSRELVRLGKRHDKPAWVAAGVFLDEYLAVLDARGEVDYAGLVVAATNLLARNDVQAATADKYAAVFVDEFQDTDPSQERLLQTLAGAGRHLVVVGDPDQSIYAFRGADVRGILEFPDRFHRADGQSARVVTLQTSRRSGRGLLAASRLVADRIPTPGISAFDRAAHRALDAVDDSVRPPELAVFATAAEEVTAIADVLRRAHLEDELSWSAMAVLVRSGTRTIPVLRRALVAAGVPVTVAADEIPVAHDPAVAPLLTALRIADSGDDAMTADDARLLLLSPLGRALPSALRALGRQLRASERAAGVAFPRPAAVLVRDAIVDPRGLFGYDDWFAEPCRRLRELIDKARAALKSGGTPEQALWELWDGSGWARRLTADAAGTGATARNADRDLDAVVALFNAAARLEEREPRAGVATLLDELGMQDIPAGGQDERSGSPDSVRLLTAHRAKGLEWDLVVVTGVQEETWPDLRRRGSLLDADLVDVGEPRLPPTSTQLLADERRLFYVAVTRARRRLVVTAVQAVDDAGQRPSRFVEELGVPVPATRLAGTDLLSPASLVARLRRALQADATSPELKAAAARRLAALIAAVDDAGERLLPFADPSAWWGMDDWTPGAQPIRDADGPLRLSGSAVASYESCPLRWLLEREVHARGESSAAQGFGMVVHTMAQLVADGVLPPDPDVLVEQLDRVWPSLGFEAPWQRDREREQARAALSRFVRWVGASDRSAAGAERSFEISIGDVVLRGAADRVEIDDDGRVHIVDFKTGRNARRQEDVDVDPQLGVYQLAVREGGFRDVVGEGAALGGAELVWLRNERRGGLPQVQHQAALADDGPTWADELLSRTAKGIRAEAFPARPGQACGSCAFQSSCPAQPAGGQVTR